MHLPFIFPPHSSPASVWHWHLVVAYTHVLAAWSKHQMLEQLWLVWRIVKMTLMFSKFLTLNLRCSWMCAYQELNFLITSWIPGFCSWPSKRKMWACQDRWLGDWSLRRVRLCLWVYSVCELIFELFDWLKHSQSEFKFWQLLKLQFDHISC